MLEREEAWPRAKPLIDTVRCVSIGNYRVNSSTGVGTYKTRLNISSHPRMGITGVIVCCDCRAFEKYNNCKHGLAAVAASRPPAVQPIARRAMHKGKAALGLTSPETYQLDILPPPEDEVPAPQSGTWDLVPVPGASRREVKKEQVVVAQQPQAAPGYLNINKLQILRTKL